MIFADIMIGSFLRRLALAAAMFISPLWPGAANAQEFFERGYLVTHDHDTVYVEIDNQEWIRNPESITVRDGASGPRVVTTRDVVAFGVGGDAFEVKDVWIDETPFRASGSAAMSPSGRSDIVFLRRIVDGPLTLYSYRDGRDHFFIDDGSLTRELISHQYLQQQGGVFHLVRNERFRAQVEEYRLNHCPSVPESRITYGEPAFASFVRRCNAAITGTDAAVERRPLRIRHTLYAGGTSTTTRHGTGDDRISVHGSVAPVFGYFIAVDRPRGRGRTSIVLGADYASFRGETAPRPGSLQSVEEARHQRVQASGLVRSRYGSAPVRPVADVGFTLVRHFGQSEARHVEPGSSVYPGVIGGVGLEYGPVLIGAKYTRTLGFSTGFTVGASIGF